MRCLAEGVRQDRWRPLMREIHDLLRPQGWLQSIEVDLRSIRSISDNMHKRPGVKAWTECYMDCMTRLERESNVSALLDDKCMHDAGFRDVRRERLKLPIGGWDKSTYQDFFKLDTSKTDSWSRHGGSRCECSSTSEGKTGIGRYLGSLSKLATVPTELSKQELARLS